MDNDTAAMVARAQGLADLQERMDQVNRPESHRPMINCLRACADALTAQAAEIARLTGERDAALRGKECFQRTTRAHWEALCAMRNSGLM